MASEEEKLLQVKYLARVEGEGAFYVKVKDNRVTSSKLNIFEPPRFFEAFLRDRDYHEVPDITARICGICPIAYQMSSVTAVESALGIEVSPEIEELRRLLYCGEWIESHGLHILMLHAPDFLGYEDGIAMAKDHGPVVESGLALKKMGNTLVEVLGGREIHPVNVRVGGFYRAPTNAELNKLLGPLEQAYQRARDLVGFTAGLPFPEFEQDYEFVTLYSETEYPFNRGRIKSSSGLDISINEYEKYFFEEHVQHSTALHSQLKYKGKTSNYLVGPMARFNLCFDHLPEEVKQLAKKHKLELPVKNPFKSILVRALETLYAVIEARRIITGYKRPTHPYVDAKPAKSTGYGASEAPRGLLYHRYQLNDRGLIESAKIVPPTSQNQPTIESDLVGVVESNLQLEHQQLTHLCEQTIRNYDPCISCSTHFLNLTIDQ